MTLHPPGEEVGVSFTDGNGRTGAPSGNNGFTFTGGTTDIAALLLLRQKWRPLRGTS